MDAPTTTSADNGPSGGGGSGGAGWFTPRKQPEVPPGEERETTGVRRPAVMRPVRRSAAGVNERPPAPSSERPAQSAEPEPDSYGSPQGVPPGQERIPPAVTAPQPFTSVQPLSPEPPQPLPPAPPQPLVPAQASPTTPPQLFGPAQTPPPTPQSAVAPAQAPPPTPSTAATPAQPPPPTPSAPATQAQGLYPAPSSPFTPAQVQSPEQSTPAPVPSVATTGSAVVRVPAQRSSGTVTENASPDAVLIRRTMAEVAPVADKVTSYFYALLFVRHPELRSLFPAAMDTQRDRLLTALLTAAEHIDNTEVLVAYLQNLGRGHRKYGTRPEHYPAVGECLIGALNKYATGTWDAETEAAWVRAYTTISQVMIDAAAADELRAPAWWNAELVAHDLRTRDIAVVTVRPDQPYPFLAGQYTSLETPWWPRIWRHYSFASAPRSDGLLTFHVKAVPAGWVSNALVHRARPGDVIRLGPPTGSMTVNHSTDSGLLCLGGGTGIAPIKALVEDVAEHGERRPVEVFYGARTDHDLYDIDTMLRLQQSYPWLTVRTVVDQQARLQLPDAIRTYGPWAGYDAYVSGPTGMIRSGVDALKDVGVPAERIRHDSVEELVAAGD
ncbi:globin domain-containing protein [Streptomyces hokutonensis]|uniref:globin domain-containing protein n=1 Tax=Streptomyces hokutonensis TaxID=1306990 RepID=UPI0036990211